LRATVKLERTQSQWNLAMTMPTVLVGTWDSGVFAITDKAMRRELSGKAVAGMAHDGSGGALGIVGGNSLCRRDANGEWLTIATGDFGLVCCVALAASIYVGTDEAQVLKVRGRSFERLEGFNHVAGRERWYAGTALIDGRLVGPPLGVRSMTATCDRTAILANVHVGGIPRSADQGATWHPTIDVDADVHQVCAHPTRPELVIAAAASGLCVSRDAGTTWSIEQEGLHAPYCSAVGFVGDNIFVSASTDPFAEHGALYHRPIDDQRPLRRAAGGLPAWFDGRVATDGIAARGPLAAITDSGGNCYLSENAGRTWQRRAHVASPSSLFIY
jgi:hypothetical protein